METTPPHPAEGDPGSPTPLIFVMGATGNVGGEIARGLAAAGLPFRVGVRRPDSVDFGPGAEVVAFDATRPETYGALDGVERMFMMWPPSTNVREHAYPVIDAARARGVRQIVFLSILEAQRLRVVPHRAVERYLETSGLDWVFLRASYFMQNFSGVHRDDIRVRREVVQPAGRGKTSFVDVRDVAGVGVAALVEGHRNVAYDITGDVALDYGQVADIFSVTLGRRIVYADLGPWAFVRLERSLGTPPGLILVMAAQYTLARFGFAGRVTGDVRTVLGRPVRTLRAFAEEFRGLWL